MLNKLIGSLRKEFPTRSQYSTTDCRIHIWHVLSIANFGQKISEFAKMFRAMKESLQKAIRDVSTIEDVLRVTVSIITEIKNNDPQAKIGYVAGKVTAEGIESIQKNLKRLHKFTETISKEFNGQIFSAADVFNDEVYWKINLAKPIHEEDFYAFWRKVVGSGVTDIFMTPEWEKSTGASDEHVAAKELGLTIHYVE